MPESNKRDSGKPPYLLDPIVAQSLAKTIPIEHSPCWSHKQTLGDKVLDVFLGVPTQLIRVPVTEVRKLVKVEMDGGEVKSVVWADGMAGITRSDRFNQLVNGHITDGIPQFFPSHSEQSKINKIPNIKSRRGRKPRGGLIVQFGGKCHYHIVGCPTLFVGGLDIEACKVIGLECAATVSLKLILYRKDGAEKVSCCHPENTPMGRLSGTQRTEVRQAVSGGNLYSVNG